MNKYYKINKKIFELDKENISYAVATVINVKGSSSGKNGDKAIYNNQGKRIMGYIGGGCIENRIGESAKETIIGEINSAIGLIYLELSTTIIFFMSLTFFNLLVTSSQSEPITNTSIFSSI